MDIEPIINAYIVLRDKRDDIKRKSDEERALLKGHMDKLEALADKLLGPAQSVSTDSGTAYRSRTIKAKVTDREAWFDYIKTTQHWEFLTTHVASTEVQKFMEESVNIPPPEGLDLSEELSVNFRRS
jgi:hypothetical protein